jgi:osmoprotectant transport system ATP-binding protein
MEEAVKMGDVIAVMDQGQLLQMTDPEDLLRNPREGFVKNLVGGVDRSLRLLSLTKVGDVMVSEAAHPASNSAAAADAHLSANDNLRDALCRLMWDSSHSLPVLDDQGSEVGHVSLQDVVEKGARV